MSMTSKKYKAFMEEYFKNNHIPDKDRHKWDRGTRELLGGLEKIAREIVSPYEQETGTDILRELTKQQEDAREAYLYKTGSGYKSQIYKDNTDSWEEPEFADNTKYTYKLPPPEEEPDYPLHRMCEECYKERFSILHWERNYSHLKLLSEQEPCHYCFNPTRSLAALEESHTQCSFLHLEREDDE